MNTDGHKKTHTRICTDNHITDGLTEDFYSWVFNSFIQFYEKFKYSESLKIHLFWSDYNKQTTLTDTETQ